MEAATVGREGMAGLPVFLDTARSPVLTIARISGVALRMRAEAFTDRATPGSELHRLMLRCTGLLLTQMAQSAACNGAHLLEQRCARWILTTHDGVDGDDLEITQEFLAFMLGVRRAGVSVAMNELQRAGAIEIGRGRVRIVDRAGLERASCECYGVMNAHHEQANDACR